MKILILAVGKVAGPERDLCARYTERALKLGRQIGISGLTVTELADRVGPTRAADEGAALIAKAPKGPLIALDERGKGVSSEGFANALQAKLDAGKSTITFAIGGADGHPPAVRERASEILSLSPMTLPHQLARVTLLEQIYRAITLCAGHPYHRS
ncbi:MAG: 23S rRNA (pseudouridine(1915)-N(3))-methyltransferase RlmH [Pseudomonadota bacterium]